MSKIIRAPRMAQRQMVCTQKHDWVAQPAVSSCPAHTSSVLPQSLGTLSVLTTIRSRHHSQVRS
jgi:3-polyprenyl-4-hydroxybenzoate decarboxylase